MNSGQSHEFLTQKKLTITLEMAAPTARATAASTMTKVRSEVRASDLVVGASETITL